MTFPSYPASFLDLFICMHVCLCSVCVMSVSLCVGVYPCTLVRLIFFDAEYSGIGLDIGNTCNIGPMSAYVS